MSVSLVANGSASFPSRSPLARSPISAGSRLRFLSSLCSCCFFVFSFCLLSSSSPCVSLSVNSLSFFILAGLLLCAFLSFFVLYLSIYTISLYSYFLWSSLLFAFLVLLLVVVFLSFCFSILRHVKKDFVYREQFEAYKPSGVCVHEDEVDDEDSGREGRAAECCRKEKQPQDVKRMWS